MELGFGNKVPFAPRGRRGFVDVLGLVERRLVRNNIFDGGEGILSQQGDTLDGFIGLGRRRREVLLEQRADLL